ALVVSNLISGLSPGATYHFRLVASNSAGTTTGVDQIIELLAYAFIGGDMGEGLDFQGDFVYAVNVGDNGAPGLIGNANFTADSVPGVSLTTPGGSIFTLNT